MTSVRFQVSFTSAVSGAEGNESGISADDSRLGEFRRQGTVLKPDAQAKGSRSKSFACVSGFKGTVHHSGWLGSHRGI